MFENLEQLRPNAPSDGYPLTDAQIEALSASNVRDGVAPTEAQFVAQQILRQLDHSSAAPSTD